MTEKVRAHIFVSGRVQGVFLRANTKRKAQILGLKGWVKNLPDGRVEAVFEGEKQKIEQILNWIKRGGSSFARVDNIEVEWQEYKAEFGGFEVRH